MRIVVTAESDTIESNVDQRFGRCKYFLIVEIENDKIKEVKAVENEGALQGHGAGPKAAQQIGDLGIDTLITGNLGPNATGALSSLGIRALHASGKAKDAVDRFIKGELEEINEVSDAHPNDANLTSAKEERMFIPLLDDNGTDSNISPHFGHAPFFGVYDLTKKTLEITKNDLNHMDPDKSPIDQIEEAVNPTIIFARDIGRRAVDIISQKGLSLKTGSFDTVKDVIENIDKLEDLTEDCGHDEH